MSLKNFGTQLLTLPAIFQNHFFTVPDYQRGYSWERRQVEELLKDIEHLMNDPAAVRHYTGTLVLSQVENGVENEFHVVDGQQRLTSLVTLMKVLSDRLDDDVRADFSSLYLRRGPFGNDRTVLCLNADTRHFFERVVLGDGNASKEPPTLEAHERLLDARKVMEKWLTEQISAGLDIATIRSTVESELGFLVYAPLEDAETGIMFEVINNRGKQLSELEKVKNYLVYCCVKLSAKSLRASLNMDWSRILRNLNAAKKTSPSDEGSFLRYCVAVHFRLNKTDSQYGYDKLKTVLNIEAALSDAGSRDAAILKIATFVDFLKQAALWYARLYGKQHTGLPQTLIPVLNQLRAQGQHASVMPLFLALAVKLEPSSDRLIHMLNLIEVLNFRVYLARDITQRNDTGQGDLYYFASTYYHGILLDDFTAEERHVGRRAIESNEDALEYFLVRFTLNYSSDERFKSSFTLETESPFDFYGWSGLRYFLMSYEQKLQPNKDIQIDKILLFRKDGRSADYLSVEHLWARENRNQDGENNRRVDELEKRRLGNFVLLELRLNIQGGNDGIEEKLPRYLDGFEEEQPTDLAQVRRMARDARVVLKKFEDKKRAKNYYLESYRELNSLQEQRYIDFAEKRWSLNQFLGYRQLVNDALATVLMDE
jgi:hypothetical protein